MNVSATLNAVKLLVKPSLCLPHATIASFDKLPIAISEFLSTADHIGKPDIRAIVLDKDNCFAKPKENAIYGPYTDHFLALQSAFPHLNLLIVSNSAGTGDDIGGKEAKLLEVATGVHVFRHSIKKPGCGSDVLNHLITNSSVGLSRPSQVAVVGDRLLTDVMMANLMGAWAVWVKDGVVRNDNPFSRLEKAMPHTLGRLGFRAPSPQNP
ncbi:hypothetical protein ACLMJK_000694 [Lecanora helva]